MRLPSHSVFWNIIASQYIDLSDLAVFEASVDNHKMRYYLMLYSPPQSLHHSSSKSKNFRVCKSLSCDESNNRKHKSYEMDYFCFNKDISIILKSAEMIDWCNRRRFRLPNVTLGFEVGQRKKENQNAVSCYLRKTFQSLVSCVSDESVLNGVDNISLCDESWDIFNFIEILYVNKWEYIFNNNQLFERLHSLRSLISNRVIYLDNTIKTLINQNELNVKRSSNSIHLESLSFLLLSRQSLKSLIFNVPTIRSINISRSLLDDDIMIMSRHWKHLETLELSDCCFVSDFGLLNFAGSENRFRSLQIHNCRNITLQGFYYLLANSSETFESLSVTNMIEDDVISLVKNLPCIKHINLQQGSSIIDLSYSSKLIKALGKYTPKLLSLSLPITSSRISKISQKAVYDFTRGCKYIEVLKLGSAVDLHPFSLVMISSAYKQSLKEIYVMGLEYSWRLFVSCKHRIKIFFLRWNGLKCFEVVS